ncbi:hypothetical protein ACHAQJ_005800 [Trichoderma viride]
MENQFKKLNGRIDALMKDIDTRFKNIARHFDATEARIEELSVELNMLSAMQSTSEYNARARDQNSLVTGKEMYLCPLRNGTTNDDVRCPRTIAELETYKVSELDALLEDLGEPIPKSPKHKIEIVKWAMGIRTGRYT